jgi:hypothetical protein
MDYNVDDYDDLFLFDVLENIDENVDAECLDLYEIAQPHHHASLVESKPETKNYLFDPSAIEADGDLFSVIRSASKRLFVPVVNYDLRADIWRQNRAEARRKLDQKRLRWKCNQNQCHYPDRKQRANGRRRIGGKFQKEVRPSFRPMAAA